jgi:hypothetical protein
MLRLTTLALLACSTPVLAQEINVYSHRQPELIQPLADAFTAETGIAVNVAFVDKGMAERLQADKPLTPRLVEQAEEEFEACVALIPTIPPGAIGSAITTTQISWELDKTA